MEAETVAVARRVGLAAAQRGRRLLAQLRDLQGNADGERQSVSIHAILEQDLDRLGRQFPQLRFHPKLSAERDLVHGRPEALRHLLHTLLSGVADGLGPRPGFVGVSTRDGVGEHADKLHIEIRDGGGLATFAGVDAALDESLRQEQNDEAGAYADWVHLAERVDADIRILQDEDVVTRVEILLPREERISREGNGGRHQVWLVQDNEHAARAVTQMLPARDFAVTHLHGGEDLRDYFVEAPVPPDVVILEYNLPDVRGTVLRSWLYEQDPDLPVILVSGFDATHPGIATASNLPSTQYLQKPFDADALLDLLRMVIPETLPGLD